MSRVSSLGPSKWIGAAAAGMLLLACSGSHTPSENSQTHWLRECTTDDECGGFSCVCGVCNTFCTNDDGCEARVGGDAVCVPADSVADGCSSRAAAKRVCTVECKRNSECEARSPELACVEQVCKAVASARPQVDASGLDAGGKDGGEETFPMSDAALTDAALFGPDASADGSLELPPGITTLSCDDEGQPNALPDGAELIASDFNPWSWSVSKEVVTWLHDPGTMEPFTLGRVSTGGGRPSFVTLEDGASYDALATDGTDAFTRYWRYSDLAPGTTYIEYVPQTGATLNLALESGGSANEDLAFDDDALYWLQKGTPTEATLLRVPRTPGASMMLGSIPLSGTAQTVVGPVAIGGVVYFARNEGSTGQVMRASADGNGALEPLGAALPAVGALIVDGSDLLLMLGATRDALDNPTASARVARMKPDGELQEVVDVEGEPSTLARVGDRLYWGVSDRRNANSYRGMLWSAPADGSAAPAALLAVEHAALGPRMHSAPDGLYFVLGCLRVLSSNPETIQEVPQLLRLSP